MNTNRIERPAPGPECARFADLLPLARTDTLDPEAMASLQVHTATCPWCQQELAAYATIEAGLRRHIASETATLSNLSEGEIQQLADRKPPHRTTPTRGRPPVRTRRLRQWWSATGAIAAVLLIAALAQVLFANRPRPVGITASGLPGPAPTVVPTDTRVIPFPLGPLACVGWAAWSTDGLRIAAVGYARGCASDQAGTSGPLPTGAMLAIIDAASGRLTQSIPLDTALLTRALPSAAPDGAQSTSMLSFSAMMWSPADDHIALSFSALTYQGSPTTGWQLDQQRQGLALVDVFSDTASVHVILAPVDAPGPVAPSAKPTHAVRYDLMADTATSIALPQAVSYAWGPNGALVPHDQLSSTSDATPAPASAGPVGQLSGGRTFTIWQTVDMQTNLACLPSGGLDPNALSSGFLSVMATLSAWSPDGRYIIDGFAMLGRLPGTPPFARTPAAYYQGQLSKACGVITHSPLPQVAVHDAALQRVVAAMNPSTLAQVQAVWSPDGTYVAATPTDQGGGEIAVYRCQTGQAVAQLDPAQLLAHSLQQTAGGSFLPPKQTMEWSPTGDRLLVVDASHDGLILVAPEAFQG